MARNSPFLKTPKYTLLVGDVDKSVCTKTRTAVAVAVDVATADTDAAADAFADTVADADADADAVIGPVAMACVAEGVLLAVAIPERVADPVREGDAVPCGPGRDDVVVA
jgi:hypothetical protein